jgi:diguanylate cyclase (GGDEF)-like protein
VDGELAGRILAARMRLAAAAPRHSLKGLLVATLDEAGALTGSPVGFFHFLEEDQVTLTLQAWSSRTTREFCRADGLGKHYPVSQAGVWADCIRLRRAVVHNDYASLPRRGDLPPGHVELVRELVVPVFRGSRIVAVLGVGNRATDYEARHVEEVETLADLAWDMASGKVLAERLRHSQARLHGALEVMDQGVGLWNPSGRLVYANPALRRLFDLPGMEGEVSLDAARLGLAAEDGSPLDPEAFPPSRAIRTGRSASATLRLVDGQEDARFVLVKAYPLHDPADGGLLGAAASLSDVTDLESRQRSLEEKARHDPLTGLPNRFLLLDRLDQAIASARRSASLLAVCLVDLDEFKVVNDRFGHAAGDDVLREVGRRLRSTLRGGDTVARIGGDEFVLLLAGTRQRPEIDRALQRMVEIAREPVQVDARRSVRVSASIGVAAYPDDATDPQLLLRRADLAMHTAKQLGRDRWAWYAAP